MNARRAAGFTLLEMLVAISIVAIALLSATRALGSTIHAAAGLREHAVASWVAQNRLAEMRAHRQWPALGQRQGRVDMAGGSYVWTERISATPNNLFRRIDVEVSAADDKRPLGRMSGYVARPPR
ncbi:type II secretion system minor pseudopilin GspI [Thauera sp. WB-2]|uniref:type II secretion system minor pseudopilin GspI n=1 Tax=Thauera sp. WB-2 TaxID=2897772 RepID=UPI0022DE1509|nr:type II secretion system minor pseudopilin GspI [Thauera sp. WB-2]WBL62452.1 type II secretion system minor pseudopilin GspI [Thauera sp. WB-2]